MRTLFVHPSALMYSEIFLRLEPLGLERVAGAARKAGHDTRLIDLQVFNHRDLARELDEFRPDAVGFGLNYLANVPEALDLAHLVKRKLPGCFVFAGGHSLSFIAQHVLDQSGGGLDAVIRGEGEPAVAALLDAVAAERDPATVPGVVGRDGSGPAPVLLDRLEDVLPARDLARRRRRYFIGELDPCASIEFTRGCPWDCSFCSAWTFYGRAYRRMPADAAAEELASIAEPNVFIVDDVAFIKAEHGHGIADEIERRRIRKRYYLETRADVLLRNQEVFERWRRLGLEYMFLGMEALDESGLELFRERINPNKNFEALEVARRIGLTVAVNLIVDTSWDRKQFELVRQWALSVPEIVHLTVITPYPGTEIWHTESQKLTTLDYRLFDIQHAVLPTKLPLAEFYRELVLTQSVINRKHLKAAAVAKTFQIMAGQLLRGQTNFARMIWKFSSVYNADRQLADHGRDVSYEMPPPTQATQAPRTRTDLYIHPAPARAAG